MIRALHSASAPNTCATVKQKSSKAPAHTHTHTTHPQTYTRASGLHNRTLGTVLVGHTSDTPGTPSHDPACVTGHDCACARWWVAQGDQTGSSVAHVPAWDPRSWPPCGALPATKRQGQRKQRSRLCCRAHWHPWLRRPLWMGYQHGVRQLQLQLRQRPGGVGRCVGRDGPSAPVQTPQTASATWHGLRGAAPQWPRRCCVNSGAGRRERRWARKP